jgi:hypothetical protein
VAEASPAAAEIAQLLALLLTAPRGEASSAEQVALGRILAAAVKLYAREVERTGVEFAPFADAEPPSATEVCVAASAMLRAQTIEVFELAMWNTWGVVA